MRAVVLTEPGPPDVLHVRDLPDPSPGPGEYLVRVAAVSVNPIDTYLRAGTIAPPIGPDGCYVVGCDWAGTVAAVGPPADDGAVDGTDGGGPFAVGDRVWGCHRGLLGVPGSTAELLTIPARRLYRAPDALTDAQAAAGALVGVTAWLGLFNTGGLDPGHAVGHGGGPAVVFVHGGTGGVGSSVVQLAKAAGAAVIATAGGEEKRSLCRDLGADLALDYRDDDLPAAVRRFCDERGRSAGGGGVDLWYETRREPDLAETLPLMAPRGRVVLMAGRDARPCFPMGQFYPRDLSLRGFAMFNATAAESRRAAEHLRALADRGAFTPAGRPRPADGRRRGGAPAGGGRPGDGQGGARGGVRGLTATGTPQVGNCQRPISICGQVTGKPQPRLARIWNGPHRFFPKIPRSIGFDPVSDPHSGSVGGRCGIRAPCPAAGVGVSRPTVAAARGRQGAGRTPGGTRP